MPSATIYCTRELSWQVIWSKQYMYPTRLDILQVPRKDILKKVDLCTTVGRTYTLRAEENHKINKKHASFLKYILLVSEY
jgi:hypothetical protein